MSKPYDKKIDLYAICRLTLRKKIFFDNKKEYKKIKKLLIKNNKNKDEFFELEEDFEIENFERNKMIIVNKNKPMPFIIKHMCLTYLLFSMFFMRTLCSYYFNRKILKFTYYSEKRIYAFVSGWLNFLHKNNNIFSY